MGDPVFGAVEQLQVDMAKARASAEIAQARFQTQLQAEQVRQETEKAKLQAEDTAHKLTVQQAQGQQQPEPMDLGAMFGQQPLQAQGGQPANVTIQDAIGNAGGGAAAVNGGAAVQSMLKRPQAQPSAGPDTSGAPPTLTTNTQESNVQQFNTGYGTELRPVTSSRTTTEQNALTAAQAGQLNQQRQQAEQERVDRLNNQLLQASFEERRTQVLERGDQRDATKMQFDMAQQRRAQRREDESFRVQTTLTLLRENPSLGAKAPAAANALIESDSKRFFDLVGGTLESDAKMRLAIQDSQLKEREAAIRNSDAQTMYYLSKANASGGSVPPSARFSLRGVSSALGAKARTEDQLTKSVATLYKDGQFLPERTSTLRDAAADYFDKGQLFVATVDNFGPGAQATEAFPLANVVRDMAVALDEKSPQDQAAAALGRLQSLKVGGKPVLRISPQGGFAAADENMNGPQVRAAQAWALESNTLTARTGQSTLPTVESTTGKPAPEAKPTESNPLTESITNLEGQLKELDTLEDRVVKTSINKFGAHPGRTTPPSKEAKPLYEAYGRVDAKRREVEGKLDAARKAADKAAGDSEQSDVLEKALDALK